ncbi:709_t:CDS:1, partial [Ambispora gerdemannii]
MPKLHELTGQITSKEPRKVYDKKSPYHGNTHYKLQALIENKKKEENLFVYPNLVSPAIFQTVEQSQYIDKRYLFFCTKKAKG